MIDPNIRNSIQHLRSKGLTYTEICDRLGQNIPKGTISYICKAVVLPEEYFVRQRPRMLIALKKARQKAASANNEKLRLRFEGIRKKAYEVVKSESKASHEKIHLAMLYKAEGSKYRSYRGLALGSSEALILRIYISLLESYYDKNRDDFRARIQHRADQNPEQLEKYWSKVLGISSDMFYRSYFDKRTVGKPTLKTGYRGVCVISCSGADIQLELEAIAEFYSERIWTANLID